MSKNTIETIKELNLNEIGSITRTIIIFLSSLGLVLYFISLLIMIFYIKKVVFIKSKSFSFILLNSLTNFFEIYINNKFILPIKHIIIFISYLFQFHLITSSINRMLSGKQIFKSEKDYSLKKLIYIEILLPLVIFPYSKYFDNVNTINFFQNIIIIILLLCFYEYVKKKIDKVIQYLNENNNKDNIEIAYMEPEELSYIYTLIRGIWSFSFVFMLIFYILRFFDILLKKIEIVHFFITIILIALKESVAFLYFVGLTIVVYLLNKSYDKGEIIQTDEKFEGEDRKGEPQKLEIELDDINIERNTKKNEYKNIEKSQNDDNILEIENIDISNGKENKNNEEEKLDEEDENLKINNYSKETDKLK